MKWSKLFLILFSLSMYTHAQVWQLEKELNLINPSQEWVLDEWGQLYQWKENSLSVRNEQTGQLFQESFKYFGQISGGIPTQWTSEFDFL